MVKSPWKLLTGLLFRGKTADQHGARQANLLETPKKVEGPGANSTAYEASMGGEHAAEPESLAASQAGKGETRARQESPPSNAAGAPDTLPADEATAMVSDRTAVNIGPKHRNRRDKAPSTVRKTAKAPVHTRAAEPTLTLGEKTEENIPDPVRTLESEIQNLRSELARKLRLQNDQLRQMLSRFESR